MARKISNNGRHYGGICIAIQQGIEKGVHIINNKNEKEYIWLKLDREFFNLDDDIYVCFSYVSPEKNGREFGLDVLDRIVNDIVKYSTSSKCVIIRDLNFPHWH